MLVPATTGAVVCLLAAVAAWLAGRPASAAIRGAAATLAVESVFTAALLLMHLQGYSLIGPVAPGIAFIVALVLTLCLAATVALFWPVSKLTASLLLPAALWMLYLSVVNGVAALLTLS
jgi:tryptophan-rich sensory protein